MAIPDPGFRIPLQRQPFPFTSLGKQMAMEEICRELCLAIMAANLRHYGEEL
jgi:hypothetical protein